MRPGARHGVSPISRSQSGMRAGDEVRRDDGATARGRVPGTEFPLLSLPVRDASRRRRLPRRGDGTRPGARHGVSPPLAPSQGFKQETTSAEMTGRRHEAGRQAQSFSLLSLSVRDASRRQRWWYHRGTLGTKKLQEYFRPGRP